MGIRNPYCCMYLVAEPPSSTTSRPSEHLLKQPRSPAAQEEAAQQQLGTSNDVAGFAPVQLAPLRAAAGERRAAGSAPRKSAAGLQAGARCLCCSVVDAPPLLDYALHRNSTPQTKSSTEEYM
jgi:hypothetical protein